MDNEIVIGLADETCQHVNVKHWWTLVYKGKMRVKKNTSGSEKSEFPRFLCFEWQKRLS